MLPYWLLNYKLIFNCKPGYLMDIDYSEINEHMRLFDALLGPEQSKNREIRFDYDLGRDPRPDSLRPGREFSRVQITTRNVNFNPIRFSWFYHSDVDRKYWYMSSLSLRGLGISTIEEEFLSNLDKLEYLDLQGNRLNSLKIASLKSFNTLHTINLSSNYIKSISLIAAENFKNLKYLSLHNNQISQIDLSPIKHNINLNRLVISENYIENIDTSPLKNLKYLLTLDFSSNNLDHLDIDLNNPRLSVLLLNDNKLKKINFGISYLPDLSLLILSNNELTTFDTDILLKNSPNLRKLFLCGNKIDTIDWHRSKFSRIEELNLNSNNLEKIKIEGDFYSLQVLELAYNKIKSVDLLQMMAQNLKSLNLSFNPLNLIQLPPVCNLPSLKWLDLAGTSIKSFKIISEKKPFTIGNDIVIGKSRCRRIKIGNLVIQIPIEVEIVSEK